MVVPRLIILFRTLDKEEVGKFGQFLKSPYYNATPKVKALYKYLKTTHPECPFEREDKDYLFSKLFPKEPYNNRKINNLMAALSSILQDFLLVQHNRTGTLERDFNLYDIYKDKKLNNLSEKQLLKLQKTLDGNEEDNMMYYYRRFKLYHELYFHPNTSRVKGEKAQNYLDAVFGYLDLFYVQTRLLHLCEMNFRSDVLAYTDKAKRDEAGKLMKLIAPQKTPLLNIYILLYEIQIMPNNDKYIELRESVFEYIRNNGNEGNNYLLTFLNNYQSQRSKEGDVNALTELFNVYNFGFKEDIYSNKGKYISSWHFINASVTASSLKKIDWLERFIKQEQKRMRPDARENVVNLCKAYLSFAKEDYWDAVAHGSKVKRQIPNFGLPCWTLEIRAYYKTQQDYDYLDNVLRNFSNYLSRHQKAIFADTLAANRNFIIIIRQLYNAKYDRKYTKGKLTEDINGMQNIVCKTWLKKEIDLLPK